MTIDTSNSLIGLSLLTGSSLAGFGGSVRVESRAVRLAKAQFTLPPVTPPWKQAAPSGAASSQVAAIKRLASVVEPGAAGGDVSPDVQAAFVTYRALDRLRVLADFARLKTTSGSERAALHETFSKGMADLQRYLANAPSDKLTLSPMQPARRAESIKLQGTPAAEVMGDAVTKDRYAALLGLSGAEKFSLKITGRSGTDEVVVDLSSVTQPPTLDRIAAAFNAAIATVPLRSADGTAVLDGGGQPVPKWKTSFSVVKSEEGWGLRLNSMGIEQVAIDQVGAPDVLMVAAGQAASGAAQVTAMMRFDLPAGAITRTNLATLGATDGTATAEARLHPTPKPLLPGAEVSPVTVGADLKQCAMVTDAQGFTYLVGTSAGDLQANLGDGNDDLILTKVDSQGEIVWQRALGAAGRAEGAAIALAANGDLVVAGTVTGAFDGASTDGDMLVSRYSAGGEEKFSSLVRSVGADSASAVAVGADGSIFVGGQVAGGGGDAFLARLDAAGRLVERRTIDGGGTDAVRALAIGADGNLVALTSEGGAATVRRIDAGSLASDLGAVTLGVTDARALAIGQDGSIAIAGATRTALSGAQANALSGGRDGFVTRLDAGLRVAQTTYVGSGGDDQLDSLGFLDGKLIVGGRTTAAIGGSRAGAVDGFVTRIDAATGAIEASNQWGRAGVTAGPVQLTVARGGGAATQALGFHHGTITSDASLTLVAQTSLRAGDEFAFRVDGGALRKVTIGAADTLDSLADRIGKLAGRHVAVTIASADGGKRLRIEARAGHEVELVRGSSGKDALAKLGIEPARLIAAAPPDPKAPRVQPGGNYGLDLHPALSLASERSATLALEKIQNAISVTQTAFRSLYWDDNKEALVNGSAGGQLSPYLAAQLSRYRDALNRLSATSLSTGF